jgi:hypothetical protein
MTFLIPVLSSVDVSGSDSDWIIVRGQCDTKEAVIEGYYLHVLHTI